MDSKVKHMYKALLCWTVLLAVTLLPGCEFHRLQRTLIAPAKFQSLDTSSPFLKAHMHDGKVYILSSWKIDSEDQSVTGKGEVLNLNRETLRTGEFTIPVDSVVIFETNVVQDSPSVAAMTLITGASIVVSALCAANPKACFGSCPTFYVSDGNQLTLQAEGFSASVAPILEASDIDALYHARPTERRFEVEMKNEALETHVVRHVDLLAVKRQSGGRVFSASDGTFWETEIVVDPSAAFAPEGDCLNLLQAIDGQERFSEAHSEYLATRETLDIEFDTAPGDNAGVIIAARQSLMSTFLFYQGLAYMGHSAGQWIAALERRDKAANTGIGQALGGIEVLLQDEEGEWISVGEVNETGPLATDVHLVKLPPVNRERVNIRLRLTQGHWRLDAVKLVKLDKQPNPIRLSPVAVNQNGVSTEQALQLLTDSKRDVNNIAG